MHACMGMHAWVCMHGYAQVAALKKAAGAKLNASLSLRWGGLAQVTWTRKLRRDLI